MDVNYDYLDTGWPSQQTLHRISALTRVDRVAYFKVGMTAYPERRASQIAYEYGEDCYDEMTVVYETSSQKHEAEMETMLLDYYKDVEYIVETGPAAAGRKPKSGPYYVYVCRKFL